MTPPSVSMIALSPLDLEALVERAVAKALGSTKSHEVDEYLDTNGTAALLDVHPRTVARLATTAGFPGRRLGRVWRFKRSDLLAWLEAQPKTRSKRAGGAR